MKKLVLFAAVACALSLTSCGSLSNGYTATAVPVVTSLTSTNVADLEVAPVRASFQFTPSNADRSTGKDNCIAAAVQAFLKANGNADVIVSPEYRWDAGLRMIEVSGYPAKYKNFRSVN